MVYSEEKFTVFMPSYKDSKPKILSNLLNKCVFNNIFIFVVNFKNYTDIKFFKKEIVKEQKEILFTYKKYCENNNLKFVLLIDCFDEAITYRHNLAKYCSFLIELLDIKLSDIIIFGGAEHQYKDDINFAITNMCTYKKEVFKNSSASLLPEHHFVSLSRIVKPHRLLSTIKMIDRDLIKFGKVSLGSGCHSTKNENGILNFLPHEYKKILPLSIDGYHVGDSEKIFSGENLILNLAFVNVVQETSFDPTIQNKIFKIFNISKENVGFFNWKNLTNLGNAYYSVNTFTEKTIKSFAWGQIPLFNTVYDNLKYIRKLGFDLFDDIIDHSYDMIEDPISRIDAVIDQLEKICNWSIEDCQTYKKQNIARFIRNREIAQELHDYKFEEMALDNLQKALDRYKI